MAKRSYASWWDTRISPKNSKWLQENLTDMDVKVKSMLQIIEGDVDSFARRADMYYQKQPELITLLEEIYRGYRALAERYDHANSMIRFAHRTIEEAFPNQVLLMFADDSPASDVSGTDPGTRDMPIPEGNSEEILWLKEALAKLETEKEAGLVQYRQSLDKVSLLEAEISKTREDFSVLSDRANKAENEVVVLKEMLTRLEAEKESKLQDYQQFVDRISNPQAVISSAQEDAQKLNKRANSAGTEAQSLKSELDKLAVEKDAALDQYMQSLEIISDLEHKLQLTEEDARGFKERAEKAESEVEILRQTFAKE
ncbi:protein NETWORKED 1D isoform X2 [Sesamum indicum]|uniref:Protein NETWORKED 1D isoform X2 n=1 Tax=Sesamum indicum TaxID=4182 RepID=A0A6I9T6W6_SESIN|nr:protein NETWORKED 1D isoform X2 [Sesamum indicum]